MDYKKLIGDVGFSSARTILSLSRGILLIPIITKIFGANLYGLWSGVQAIIIISASIGGLHLHGALIRYFPQGSKNDGIFSTILTLSFLTAILTSLILICLGILGVLPNIGQSSSWIVTGSIAGVVFVKIVSLVILNYPRAIGQVKTYEIIQSFHLLIELFALATAFTLTGDIVIALLSVIFTTVLVDLVVVIHYRPPMKPDLDYRSIRKYLEYSLPMLPKEMGSRVISSADRYLLLLLLSPTSAGIYAVAYSLPTLLEKFTGVLTPTLYPSVTEAWENGNIRSLTDFYTEVLRWYTIAAFPMLAGISILAEPALRMLSTPAVASKGWILVPLLGIGFMGRGYDNVLIYILTAAEENVKIAKITTLAAFLNTILNIVLISTIGLFGAAASTIFSQILIASYVGYWAHNYVPFQFPIMSAIRSFIVTVVMVLVLFGLSNTISWKSQLVVFPIVGFLIYVAGLSLVGEVSKQDIQKFYSVIA